MNWDEYKKGLLGALERYWPKARYASVLEADNLVRNFIASCVADEFIKKFILSFQRQKPITSRFFKRKYIGPDLKSRLTDVFKVRATEPVEVSVIWGPLNTPHGVQILGKKFLDSRLPVFAYSVKGEFSQTIDSVFVDEGDALAEVKNGEKVCGYLFLDGNRGDLYGFILK